MANGAPASNVLLLLSDQQDAHALGCAGHRFVHTPHLDHLAAWGTRFTNAFTPSPICVPARAALATGRWVHQVRCWDNAIAYDGQVPGWAHQMREAGCRVESIGKLHYRSAEAPTGFSMQHEPMHIAEGIGQVWGSVRDPLPPPRPSRLFEQLGAGLSPYNGYDMRVAEHAAAWLHARARQPEARPWMLFAGFVAPHFPLVVPQRYLDAIDLQALPPPRQHPDRGYRHHPWVQRHLAMSNPDAELGSEARRRLALACYCALVSFLDEQIGIVLRALTETGLAERTLVVFSSDHGDNQGQRGLWNKSTLYREAVNVPLIVNGPDMPIGRLCATNTGLIDIAPTLLRAMGLTPPPGLPGRPLQEIAREADDPSRPAFSEYHAVGSPSAAFMMRRDGWAYHHYVGYAPELFDLDADPDQQVDLAAAPAHRSTCRQMEAWLREWVDPEATDRSAKAEQAALIARLGGRQRALQLGPGGATPVPRESVRRGP